MRDADLVAEDVQRGEELVEMVLGEELVAQIIPMKVISWGREKGVLTGWSSCSHRERGFRVPELGFVLDYWSLAMMERKGRTWWDL